MNTNDKKLIHDRFAANLARYNRLATVQRTICDELSKALEPFAEPARVTRILEIGAGTGFLTANLTRRYPEAEWVINDLVPESEAFIAQHTSGIRASFLWGDAESVALPGNIDMITSASAVQWFDDQPAFFRKCRELLSPEGVIAFSSFGPSNFTEIRELTGEGLDYYNMYELVELLGTAGFDVLHSSQYRRQMLFASPVEVLHHIKATGVNGISRVRWTKRRLEQFGKEYKKRYTTPDGSVTLTYHPIIAIAQKQ